MTVQKQGATKRATSAAPSTKQRGDAAEQRALEYLQAQGLRLQCRNFKTPGRGGGEVDLIMRDAAGVLVFVEVRQRRSEAQGGAAASIDRGKQRRIVFAARHYLLRCATVPPCRFDVVLLHGEGPTARLEWMPAAFDASGWA